jgi:hypothetical protein
MSTRIEHVKLEVERIRQKAKLHCDSQIKEFNKQLYQVTQLSIKTYYLNTVKLWISIMILLVKTRKRR